MKIVGAVKFTFIVVSHMPLSFASGKMYISGITEALQKVFREQLKMMTCLDCLEKPSEHEHA
jgi:hypothetical protein